jgi:hypothetical protein
VDSHQKIIILASDGMANIEANGQWTGYQGNTSTGMGGCNGQAETDATNAAAAAKTAGITVFTIAIGDSNVFSPVILQAMASTNTDPNKAHFFQASDANAMANIYSQLGQRIVNYGGSCQIQEIDTGAAGATISIYRNGSGTPYATLTASPSGSFSFANIDPGTYTFSSSITADGLTYDHFTAGIGGLDTTPSIVVGNDSGTYSIDLSLKTTNPPSCGGV